ncbi:MAG TPA: hypothetical protein VEL28_04595 [Candidatus Binatia bacterium]|nr:hypothetical protein [Candidatus Binatia bacterium]
MARRLCWANRAPSRHPSQLTLTNLRSLPIDVGRAALDPAQDLVLETQSDGETTLDLYGLFPAATEIYEDGVPLCLGDGAIIGAVGARVPVKAGSHVYTLEQPREAATSEAHSRPRRTWWR